jgi:hypothetical protein
MKIPVIKPTMTIRNLQLLASKTTESFLLGVSFEMLILTLTNFSWNSQLVNEPQLLTTIISEPIDSMSLPQDLPGWHTVNVYYGEKKQASKKI